MSTECKSDDHKRSCRHVAMSPIGYKDTSLTCTDMEITGLLYGTDNGTATYKLNCNSGNFLNSGTVIMSYTNANSGVTINSNIFSNTGMIALSDANSLQCLQVHKALSILVPFG